MIIGQPIPGEENIESKLERQIQESGLGGKVFLLGFRADVPALMHRFSIFCLTSESEGTPNTVLEAMAAARPVVATRVGGVPDVVADGRSGFLIPPDDSDALASKLIELLDNPGLRYQMGQEGRQIVEKEYTCHASVQRLKVLYQDYIAGKIPNNLTLSQSRGDP